MQIPFYLVDVFADRPLTGNPLALVPQAAVLDDAAMPQIARELGQAETTFLTPSTNQSADWRLRSFTAGGVEVFGAGHNSLGAWWWLAESGALKLSDGANRFTQEIGERFLPVEIQCEGQRLASVVLTQTPPIFGAICEELPSLARSLGLEASDLMTESLPAQVVSTGAAHLLVPVRSRAAIGRASPDASMLARILRDVGGQGCYLFCLDPVHARFFNPTVGIVEDSATGSAAGPLACHLVAHGIVNDGATVIIEQGLEMERQSLLTVHVAGNLVRLAGRCVTVANGALRVR